MQKQFQKINTNIFIFELYCCFFILICDANLKRDYKQNAIENFKFDTTIYTKYNLSIEASLLYWSSSTITHNWNNFKEYSTKVNNTIF